MKEIIKIKAALNEVNRELNQMPTTNIHGVINQIMELTSLVNRLADVVHLIQIDIVELKDKNK